MSGLALDVHTTGEAFSTLQGEWQELESRAAEDNIFLTFSWQHAWWAELGQGHELELLAFRDAGRLVAVAPTYHDTSGGGDVINFGGGLEVTDYLGFLVETGYEERVAEDFLRHFQASPGALLDFHFLHPGGVTLSSLRAAAARLGLRCTEEEEEVSPRIQLGGSWEDYLAGLDKKDRHELRRKRRRLEEAGGWELREATAETLPTDLETFFDLHAASTRAKADFMTDPVKEFFRHICIHLQEEGWLCLRSLVFEGRTVAAVLGFIYRGKLLLYNSGYDPTFNRLSCGFVLMTEEVRLAVEQGLTEVDFLRGNERYKYELGARDVTLSNLKIG
jgi:CelD/BcsL family acetyltransferase involved in cellulose biosynthesis